MHYRVMTYNVHGCRGTDGKISVERIAEVIGRYEPDVVALQELDLGRERSGEADQPHLIARELGMKYHFHPAMQVEEEQYGNAILSAHPLRLRKSGTLQSTGPSGRFEPRGALWVSVRFGQAEVQVINTHLGLNKKERRGQVRQLLGVDWAGHAQCRDPVIFCGDFNARSTSRECHWINRRFNDVQMALEHHRPKATWASHFPFFRIDHIFVSGDIDVARVDVPGGRFNRLASDHLPLIVDLQIPDTAQKNIDETQETG